MKIQGTTALVTGANRGLGRALVEALLARGARRVYAAARDPKRLESAGVWTSDRVVPLALDVTDAAQVERAAKAAADVDLVVSNAGLLASFGLVDGDPALVRRDLETNFFGLLHLARAFAPVLAARPGSALVSVLSVASLASMPAIGGYSSSKAAAWSLTQTLRAELATKGIRTHAVFPGPIDTDMIRGFEMPKTSAADVARAILDGVEADAPDIFPDPMSKDVGALYGTDPRAVEKRFAAPSA